MEGRMQRSEVEGRSEGIRGRSEGDRGRSAGNRQVVGLWVMERDGLALAGIVGDRDAAGLEIRLLLLVRDVGEFGVGGELISDLWCRHVELLEGSSGYC